MKLVTTLFTTLLFTLSTNAQTISIPVIPYPLHWDIQPLHFTAKGNTITIVAGKKTDMFRDPNVTYNTDNSPKLLFVADVNFVLTAAIEHGFKGNAKGGNIDIEFRIIDDLLRIQVVDNGKGIKYSLGNSESKSNHKSMAVQITKERLLVLNRSKRQKVTFDISDISEETSELTGTKVVFTIPVV